MRTLLLLASFLWATCSYAQTIKIGDNLKQEFKKIDKAYFFDAPPFTEWAEGTGMLLIGDQPIPQDCEHLFLALKDTTLIGVFRVTKPNIFLFDTRGESVLTTASEFFMIPGWVVKRNTKVSAADRTFYTILDQMYEQALQADSGDVDEQILLAYQQFTSDVSLANRHIAVLFDTYQTILRETASKGIQPPGDICIPLINQVAEACMDLYGSVPAIVNIYQGEALERAGEVDKARAHFKKSLKTYPNSIPIMVYNCELELDSAKKKALANQLKAQHPEHWMVKEMQ